MSNTVRNILGLAILVTFIGVIVYLFTRPSNKQYHWRELYNINGEEPYDLEVIHHLLKTQKTKRSIELRQESLYRYLPNYTYSNNSAYLFIGNSSYINNNYEVTSLLEYVENGNTAYIITNTINDVEDEDGKSNPFLDSLKISITNYQSDKLRASVKYKGNDVATTFVKRYLKTDSTKIYTIDSSAVYHNINLLEGNNITVLGSSDGRNNFIKIRYGKGYFYLHSSPILFTNYSLSNEEAFKYAEAVFAHLPTKNTLFWDIHNIQQQDYNSDSQKNRRINSPLSVIFKNQSLTAAWYIFLFLVLCYILVYTRRKQRIIPIYKHKKNNSVEYAKTIGMLYLRSPNHKYIVKYLMRQFRLYLKNAYRIDNRLDMKTLIKTISMNSGIEISEIESMYTEYEKLQKQITVKDDELLSFYQKIEYFYNHCK